MQNLVQSFQVLLRRSVLALALISAGLLFKPTNGHADAYVFERGHTTLQFSWMHAGLSRNSGRIVGVAGALEFDPANPAASLVAVAIEPGRISTGVSALDRLLRSIDFFDVLNNATVTFKSTAITVTGERTGEVTGDLTIRDVTRPVTLAVKWNFTGEHPLGLVNPSFAGQFVSGFSATTRLLRSDFGLGRGAPLISDEVEIAIEAEVVRK